MNLLLSENALMPNILMSYVGFDATVFLYATVQYNNSYTLAIALVNFLLLLPDLPPLLFLPLLLLSLNISGAAEYLFRQKYRNQFLFQSSKKTKKTNCKETIRSIRILMQFSTFLSKTMLEIYT